jgi:ribosomal protein S3
MKRFKKLLLRLLPKIYIKILGSECVNLKNDVITYYMEQGAKNHSRFNPTLAVNMVITDYFEKYHFVPIINGIIVDDTEKCMNISIYLHRVGVFIGKGGENFDEIKKRIELIFNKDVDIQLKETPCPFGLSYIMD